MVVWTSGEVGKRLFERCLKMKINTAKAERPACIFSEEKCQFPLAETLAVHIPQLTGIKFPLALICQNF